MISEIFNDLPSIPKTIVVQNKQDHGYRETVPPVRAKKPSAAAPIESLPRFLLNQSTDKIRV